VSQGRRATVERRTKETHVVVTLDLDGRGEARVRTGLGFLDHMLAAFAKHGLLDLEVTCEGDLHVDEHHSVEDVAITLGTAIARATADKAGLVRFGHSYVPMDEALVRAVLDLSGRPWLAWRVPRLREKVGDLPVELAEHFWHSVAQHGGITLHVEALAGTNQHHLLEAVWKACGRALLHAVERSPRIEGPLSTKGVLGERGVGEGA
jgi:imidazoleglycerol-phosphate dehydratase